MDASMKAEGLDRVYARRMALSAPGRQRAASWLRGMALLGLMGGFALFGACRGIVAGDSINAVDELCSLLESCYPGQYDCSGMTQDLESATPSSQKGFLSSFDPTCLESCAQARACTDLDPFCSAEACAADFDCCGWSRGELACGDGQCCKPTGQLCETRDDCCGTTDCVVSQAGDKTCGGVDCLDLSVPCAENAQCCSNYCGPKGICEQVTCADQGGKCSSNEDCCDKRNDAGDALFCGQDHCQYPNVMACIESGNPCEGNLECCQTGDQCSNGPGSGVCGPPGCVKEGETCEPDDLCCDTSAICLPNNHCGISTCGVQGTPCQLDDDCCTLQLECSSGECQKCVVENTTCHSVCETGGALQPGDASDPEGVACFPTERPCILRVGMVNRDCVCTEWGQDCVDLAIELCDEQSCITPD